MAEVSWFIGFGDTCLWKLLEAAEIEGDRVLFLAVLLRTGLKTAGDRDFLTVLSLLLLTVCWRTCACGGKSAILMCTVAVLLNS